MKRDTGSEATAEAPPAPDVLVTGATGFIGRWLVPELTRLGHVVLVALRKANARSKAYRRWVAEHGGNPESLVFHEVDLDRDDLGLPQGAGEAIHDVFHLAGRYEFGISRAEAHRINVEGSLRVLRWAAKRPALRRYVLVSGYRVAAPEVIAEVGPGPLDDAKRDRLYRRLGAYEASKFEEHLTVQDESKRLGVPLSLVNPASVIGDSETGETTQFIGLTSTVRDLFNGKMPAMAGGPDIFVPVVTVDYLARFMARLPEYPDTAGRSYWLLDQRTPNLPELVQWVADYTGVKAPTHSLPVGLVAALPRALTGVEPETLSFLSTLRYDTQSADELASRMGLTMPDVSTSLGRWVDFLVASRFGDQASDPTGHFIATAGCRTFVAGERRRPDKVLLHGLPLDSESWREVEARFSGLPLRLDLAGLGRSSASGDGDPLAWMNDLFGGIESRPVLVGHSLGCEPALRFAVQRPEAIKTLVLVSPFFLQARPSWPMTCPAMMSVLFRFSDPERLPERLLGAGAQMSPALMSAARNLKRRGVSRRTAEALSEAASPALRDELRELVARVQVPVRLIVGEHDALLHEVPGMDVVTIPDAGHYPQLSHPEALASAIERVV